MNHAIAILTYSPKGEYDCRLDDTIYSLRKSRYPGKVFVVDDGSGDRSLPSDSGVDYVVKQHNGGIPRGKNTSIRLLMDQNIDVGFLADDDVEFKTGWWEDYLQVHEQTDIQHLSWARRDKEVVPQFHNYQGMTLAKTNYLNGLLLSFTPEVVEKVGGFWVTEMKWGWDHVNWTNRIVASGLAPYYADVPNPKISMGKHHELSAVSLEQRRLCRQYNYDRLGSIYRPLEE